VPARPRLRRRPGRPRSPRWGAAASGSCRETSRSSARRAPAGPRPTAGPRRAGRAPPAARRDPLGVLEPAALARSSSSSPSLSWRPRSRRAGTVEVFLAGALAHLLRRRRAPRAPPPSRTSAPSRSRRSRAREAVQQQELARRLQQALVLVLAVELHQELAQALEQANGGGRVVHEARCRPERASSRLMTSSPSPAVPPRRAARPPGRRSISNTAETIAVSPRCGSSRAGPGAGEEQDASTTMDCRPVSAGQHVEPAANGPPPLPPRPDCESTARAHRCGHATPTPRALNCILSSPHYELRRSTEKKSLGHAEEPAAR